jgi:hypothetical protein
LLKLHVREMPALLPLLARWQGMRRLKLRLPDDNSQMLTPAALKALVALLEAQHACTELYITDFTPHPTALLLPLLAHTSVTRVVLMDCSITEAELMGWCAGSDVARRVAVLVDGDVEGKPAHMRVVVDDAGSRVWLPGM